MNNDIRAMRIRNFKRGAGWGMVIGLTVGPLLASYLVAAWNVLS